MNLEEVIKTIDAVVFTKTGRHLSEVEIILLQGTWQGQTYEQMVENCHYSLAYMKQAAGPRLWKLLSGVLGEDISKANFRGVFERRSPIAGQPILSSTEPKQSWGDSPHVSVFYGRTQELVTLKQWIVQERCRLVAIVGLGGIGKTTLALRCAKEIQDEFEFVIWRSLRNAPPLSVLLADLLQFFSPQAFKYSSVDVNDGVSQLIEYLRLSRSLLILDNLETILRSGDIVGYYRKEYKDYRELLQRIGETHHQSCLLLTSLEKPREITALEGKTLPVRSLQLMGLQEDAQEIFREKNLSETDKWADLIQLYRGNPLALKIVTASIKELFGGNVSEFLKQKTVVFGDIRDILEEQLERLSNIEQEILYWIAITCHPVSLSELRRNILSSVSQSELIESLESLLRRSLIQRDTEPQYEAHFTFQQMVIRDYIIEQFTKQICEEIQAIFKQQKKVENIEFLRNYALLENQEEKNVEIEQLQNHLILIPIKDMLCKIYKDEKLIDEQLSNILSLLQDKSPLAVGYAGENIKNLLRQLRADLENNQVYSNF
ncbi:NB-ARC domain-containing protein [Aetokthonos hydrillicola Thurmond2011]|jgi:DNA polymerase III delta prime subunit|uniref:NB-ARC domain-containing protein n=1 Tax=Aetokthonos hydrillicola Thurmond2011 TaxID=2712845 RepID=A0AAP5MBL0_9CYAN|nr:NB-ARC domain-containing protein [Aetokthonos hydrillicola]MBO3458691.1 hypothetical protein [Aetokthonos hydrillicola CCALA 1050]MBW4588044.1 hypothetical protein [Aetokthonos hydrillicola CCALA 1050]MDR9897004.1 NB-ARC domain-containing protein [Aetokthonos hydrillicola Thurmond2011]